MNISQQTARRFIMGKQGLWPGRRWQGKEGVAQAIEQMEALQLDPLNILAHSQEIALWGRVLDFQPEDLYSVMYAERRFFDYGGALFVYPMRELPYWRTPMRQRAQDGRWARFLSEKPQLVEAVRQELQARGPLGNRDLESENRVVGNYRGRKETSLALYALWITGEVMVHHRNRFERRYHFRQYVAPPEHDWEAPQAEAEAYLERKVIAFVGVINELGWKNSVGGILERNMSKEEGHARLERRLADGLLAPVRVEGWKDQHYVLSEDLPLLAQLEAGEIPPAWQPLGPTTEEEVVFLAPLEIVSARGRAKKVFNFEYIWEVYKPAHTRRWGYYTLPILWGDRLVARIDPRLDRPNKRLNALGFWLEDPTLAHNDDFRSALQKGWQRMADFVQAEPEDLSGRLAS